MATSRYDEIFTGEVDVYLIGITFTNLVTLDKHKLMSVSNNGDATFKKEDGSLVRDKTENYKFTYKLGTGVVLK